MHNITIYSFKKKSEINVCFLLNTYSFSTFNFLSNLIIASLNSIIIQFNINSIQFNYSVPCQLFFLTEENFIIILQEKPRKFQEVFKIYLVI